ncbi:HtaA domain-containing protein [Arcanobacterium hippocoleae]|uniref:HtaA domain-containing protein n=1 Tax=Arcanobacterium hippocoleae TaxID=149017 RepID=UPI003A6216F7
MKFSGSLYFNSHKSILETTFSDPQITIEGSTAKLSVAVKGRPYKDPFTKMEIKDYGRMTIAEYADVKVAQAGNNVTITAGTGEITTQGKIAFGEVFYEVGDPINGFTVNLTTESANENPAPSAGASENPATPNNPQPGKDEPKSETTGKPALTAQVTSATKAGLNVKVAVTNVTLRAAANVPDTKKDDAGVYFAVIAKNDLDSLRSNPKAAAGVAFVSKKMLKGTTAEATIKVPAAKIDAAKEYTVVAWRAHGMLNDARLLAAAPLAVSAEQFAAVFPEKVVQPGETSTPAPAPAVNPGKTQAEINAAQCRDLAAQVAQRSTKKIVANGSLNWGVRDSFTAYIRGAIAKGKIESSIWNGTTFIWPSAGGTYDTATKSGTFKYGGTAHFTGHNGILDVTISAPIVTINGGTGTLSAYLKATNVEGKLVQNGRVNLATLSGISVTAAGNSFSFTVKNATLTSAGTAGFGGFYPVGEPLNSLSGKGTLSAQYQIQKSADGVCTIVQYGANGAVVSQGQNVKTLSQTGGAVLPAVTIALLLVGLGALALLAKKRINIH